MKITRNVAFNLAIRYAKKFGFISKSFFWDHLSPEPQSTKYLYWKLFLKSKLFIPYQEIQESTEFFYLNHRKINMFKDNIEPVSRRNSLYFYHDDKIMRIIHLLMVNNLVENYWTEQELKSNRSLALDILGGDYSKLPDLIFDLKTQGSSFRVVLEVEITRKSNDRYLRSCLGYQAFRKVDLILFATELPRIAEALKMTLNKNIYSNVINFGFIDLNQFKTNQLSTVLEINSKKVQLENFLNNLIEIKSKTQ